jgi:hypothetical protein
MQLPKLNLAQWETPVMLSIGLFSGLLWTTVQIIGTTWNFVPGDLGDGRLNLYFLEHAYQYVTGNINHYWDAPFMFPEPQVMSYSDNLLGSAPIYMGFRFAGLDTFTSFQGWFLVLASLNYLSAFLFLITLFKDPKPASLGAFVFAFSIALQSQLTHAQTFPRFAIPLAFLFAGKFNNTLKTKYLFLTIMGVVLQIYCGIYLGFMLAIPISIFLFITLVQRWKSHRNTLQSTSWLLNACLSLFANMMLLAPVIYPYLHRGIAPSPDRFRQIFSTIPTLKSHFYSQFGSPIWEFLSKIGETYPAWWDHQLFAGGIATICLSVCFMLLTISLIKSNLKGIDQSLPMLWMLTAALTFLFFTRHNQWSLYWVIYYLPGFSALRSVTRIVNIELLFFAIAIAHIYQKVSPKKPYLKYSFFALSLTLLIADNKFDTKNSYRTDKTLANQRSFALDSIMATLPKGSVVSYEPEEKKPEFIYYHLDAMLSAQPHQLQVVNGYTASSPATFSPFWFELTPQARNAWLSTNKITFDTLYVIQTPQKLVKIPSNIIK